MMPIGMDSQFSNPATRQLGIDNLNQIKDYRSQFWCIKRAVSMVKHHTLHRSPASFCTHCRAVYILNEFNRQIADYKKIVGHHENITTLEQLDSLETQLIMLELDLQRLKRYRSKVTFIRQAIRRIPRCIEIDNAPEVIREFNKQIAHCKSLVKYDENISNKKQVEELEKQLDELDVYNQSLSRLWAVLPIKYKPYWNPFLIKKWFESPQNQHALASVTSLRLSDHITRLPEELSNVMNLQELDLSVNRLKVFPEWISRYSALRKLSLSCNQLKEFPIAICQCTTLESIDMTNNRIERLPREVLQLSHLTECNLRLNRILAIPNWIRKFSKLKVLNFSYNGLNQLPFAICQCPALETLDVSNNWIEELPLVFSIWKQVRELRVAKSQASPKQLETIKLEGNPYAYTRRLKLAC